MSKRIILNDLEPEKILSSKEKQSITGGKYESCNAFFTDCIGSCLTYDYGAGGTCSYDEESKKCECVRN